MDERAAESRSASASNADSVQRDSTKHLDAPADSAAVARKMALELEKLSLENQRAKKELDSFGRPTRWELLKNSVAFFGVLVPALISVFTFLHQRDVELAQKDQELRAERLRAIERARELIAKGDRSAGVLQLSLFGEEAIPDLLGEVRVNNFHIDWPSPSLAALASLKRIGVDKLSASDKTFLRNQVDVALSQIEGFQSDAKRGLNTPRSEVVGRMAIVREVLTIIGTDPELDTKIKQSEMLLVNMPH